MPWTSDAPGCWPPRLSHLRWQRPRLIKACYLLPFWPSTCGIAGATGARLGWRFIALAVRALLVLTLAGAIFVTARVMEPALMLIAEGWPQFMGVPLPLVLGAFTVGLFVYARRFIRFSLN